MERRSFCCTASPFCRGRLLLGAAILAGSCAAAAERIPLFVDGDAANAGETIPVTCGVPLAKGSVRQAAKLTLQDEKRRRIPVQIQVTARWNDGSIKWVLLDFQIDLTASGRRELALVIHQQPQAPPRFSREIRIKSNGSHIAADAGPLRLVIDRARPTLLSSLAVDRDGNGLFDADEHLISQERSPASTVRYRREGWTTRSERRRELLRFEQKHAVSTYRASVELAGPLRAVLRIEGDHALAGDPKAEKTRLVRAAPYVLRYELYAGKRYVRVFYSLVHGGGNEEFLRDAVLPFPFNLGRGVRVGGGYAVARGRSFRRLRVVSHSTTRLAVRGEDPRGPDPSNPDLNAPAVSWPAAVRADASGLLVLAGETASVLCAVRDFGKMYPCELEAGGVAPLPVSPPQSRTGRTRAPLRPATALDVHVWPTHALQLLDGRRYSNQIYPGHYRGELPRGGGNRASQGLSLTREFVLDFSLPVAPKADEHWPGFARRAEQRARLHVRRPLARAASEHCARSGVWGYFAPYRPGRYARLESLFRLLIDHQIASRASEGWYGALDYGDVQMSPAEGRWQMHGRNGWANGALGAERAALLMFLRTGARKYFDHFDAMVRHLRDVDTVHAADWRGPGIWRNGPYNVGSLHVQGRQHWSGYAGELYHTAHGLGMIDHYLLTGDRRSLDVAILAAQFAARNRVGKMLFILNAYRLAEVCRETEGLADQAKRWFDLAEEGVKEFDPKVRPHNAFDYQTLPGLLYILADRPHAACREKLDAYLARRRAPSYWTAQAFASAALEGRPAGKIEPIMRLLRGLTPRQAYPLPLPTDPDGMIGLLGPQYSFRVSYTAPIVWQTPYLLEVAARRGLTEARILHPSPRRPLPGKSSPRPSAPKSQGAPKPQPPKGKTP